MIARERLQVTRAWVISVAALVLIVVALYSVVLFNQAYLRPYDYPQVIAWSRQLAAGDFALHPGGIRFGMAYRPNFLYQVLVAGMAGLTGADIPLSALAVSLLANVLLALTLHAVFLRALPAPERLRSGLAATLLALITLLLGPVSFLTWHRANLYLGYIAPTVYHNATLTLLRPLALLLFLAALRGFAFTPADRRLRRVVAAAALTILGAYAKPSYLLCLLPVAGGLLAIQWLRRRPANWPLLVGGIIVPGILALGLQYLFTYEANADNSVIFAPLLAARSMESVHILPKLALSLVFPVAAGVLYPRRAAQDDAFALAWLVMIPALAYAYLLAESGMVADGNFFWGAQVALFILMAAALRFFAQQVAASGSAWLTLRHAALAGALLLHLVPGLVWYYAEALTLQHWW